MNIGTMPGGYKGFFGAFMNPEPYIPYIVKIPSPYNLVDVDGNGSKAMTNSTLSKDDPLHPLYGARQANMENMVKHARAIANDKEILEKLKSVFGDKKDLIEKIVGGDSANIDHTGYWKDVIAELNSTGLNYFNMEHGMKRSDRAKVVKEIKKAAKEKEAATKIQATFKGHSLRKTLKKLEASKDAVVERLSPVASRTRGKKIDLDVGKLTTPRKLEKQLASDVKKSGKILITGSSSK